jgi:hypothetical protein
LTPPNDLPRSKRAACHRRKRASRRPQAQGRPGFVSRANPSKLGRGPAETEVGIPAELGSGDAAKDKADESGTSGPPH